MAIQLWHRVISVLIFYCLFCNSIHLFKYINLDYQLRYKKYNQKLANVEYYDEK